MVDCKMGSSFLLQLKIKTKNKSLSVKALLELLDYR